MHFVGWLMINVLEKMLRFFNNFHIYEETKYFSLFYSLYGLFLSCWW